MSVRRTRRKNEFSPGQRSRNRSLPVLFSSSYLRFRDKRLPVMTHGEKACRKCIGSALRTHRVQRNALFELAAFSLFKHASSITARRGRANREEPSCPDDLHEILATPPRGIDMHACTPVAACTVARAVFFFARLARWERCIGVYTVRA